MDQSRRPDRARAQIDKRATAAEQRCQQQEHRIQEGLRGFSLQKEAVDRVPGYKQGQREKRPHDAEARERNLFRIRQEDCPEDQLLGQRRDQQSDGCESEQPGGRVLTKLKSKMS